MRGIEVSLTNETNGYIFSEHVDKLDNNHVLDENPTMGEIYRCYQKEYGRCMSRVFIDTPNGRKTVGWFFVSRQHYEDTNKPYLRGAWVTVGEYFPATPERVEF